jgi:O-antigen/teichoic acid export membrane protein
VERLSDDPPVQSRPPEIDVLDTAEAGGLVIKGAVLRVLGYAAGTVFAVGSAVVLTRHLGVTRFGQYTTIISVVTVTGALTDLGMTSLATREYAIREGLDREHLMRDVLGLRILITVTSIVLATAFAIAAGYDLERIAGTLVAGVGLGLVSLQATVAVPLFTRLRLGQTTALELLRQAIWVGLLVLLALLGAGILPLLAATVPAGLVMLAATVVLTRRHMPIRPAIRPQTWIILLRDTLTFSLATGVGAMYVFTTQILTSLTASGVQNGLFAASFRVFIVAASIAGLVVSAAFPVLARAARDDRERLRYAVQGMFEVVVILGTAAAIAAVTGAGPIIEVVAGPRFAGAAAPLRIEGAALLASFILPALGLALISLHRHRALAIANLLALSITAALTLVLARTHGATGAAVATVCGEWVLCGAYMLALTRGRSPLRLDATVALRVAAAAIPAFAVMLLKLPAVAQLVVALVVYAALIVLFRAVPNELYAFLPFRSSDRLRDA